MAKFILHLLSSLFLCILLGSCLAEEDYTLSSTDRLRFSKDTLSFDTIIAGVPTNTYTFQVFNPAQKPVRIVSVQLKNGSSSPFLVNIDGVNLPTSDAPSTSTWDLSSNDSLRVFVQAIVPTSGLPTVKSWSDKIIFRLANGTEQEVLLTAQGQDVEMLRAKVVTRDTTLSSPLPYHIFDSLVVEKGATLTLTEGAVLLFHANTSLVVRGTIHAKGTLQNPIVMRGDRMGYMFSNQPYDRIPNQWGGVLLAAESKDNVLDYCDIHSGAFGIKCESAADTAQLTLQLTNSILHNMRDNALECLSANTEVGNTQITNAGGDCVKLVGGRHRFVHCTIGQFYSFVGRRGVALHFTNEINGARKPLFKADFINCLVTGYGNDEVMGEQSTRFPEEVFNYRFQNCLLNTPKSESGQLVQCLFEADAQPEWQREKQFLPRFDFSKLLFTFTLSPQAAAANHADAAVSAAEYPNDRLGRSRLDDGKPDIGCYEAQPTKL